MIKKIQNELRNKLGIRVDYSVVGSDSSNTGNIARKYSNSIGIVSEITELDKSYYISCVLL